MGERPLGEPDAEWPWQQVVRGRGRARPRAGSGRSLMCGAAIVGTPESWDSQSCGPPADELARHGIAKFFDEQLR